MEFIFIALDIPLGNAARGDVKDIKIFESVCRSSSIIIMYDESTISICPSLMRSEEGTVRVNIFVCLSLMPAGGCAPRGAAIERALAYDLATSYDTSIL